MAETRAGWVGYCFRKLPPASADVRGPPRHVWTTHGGWKMCNYKRKTEKYWPKWPKQGRGGILLPSASVRFRKLPRTSVAIRAMYGRTTENGSWEITRQKREKCPKWQKPGRRWGGYCIRQLPWISAPCVGGRRKMEYGKL